MSASNSNSAVILPFARRERAANRMTTRDRMVALEWSDTARDMGYTRMAFDTSTPDDEPELGDFLLIYTPDAMWATWGVGCCDSGFIVWRAGDGATISWHPTLQHALNSIPPALPRA